MSVLLAGGLTGLLNQSSAQVIDGSLRFDKTKTHYLEKTFSSAGNRKTWTWSGWFKRGTIPSSNNLWTAYNGTYSGLDNFGQIYTDAADGRIILFQDGGAHYNSAARFRDNSGWYNIVISCDVTQSTYDDRFKVYVNTFLNTSTSGTIAQNTDLAWNNNIKHYIGASNGAELLDGKLSQVYFIDGLALGPGYFGFIDPLTNTWRPKKFRAEGTTVNDGTQWSSGGGGGLYSGSNWTGTFDGTPATTGSDIAQSAYVTNNGSSTLTFSTPISGLLSFRACQGSNSASSGAGRPFVTLSDGQTIRVDGANNAPSLHSFGYVSGITTLSINGTSSQGMNLLFLELDGVLLVDSTTQNLAFGTNGFYLPLDGNSSIGEDKSGNGNDWTPVNFSGTSINPDISKDSPSGAVSGGRAQTGITTTSSAPSNYATLNPLYPNPNGNSPSDGNLKQTTTSGNGQYNATMAIPQTGSWYWEVTKEGTNSTGIIGISNPVLSMPSHNANNVGAFSWYIAGPRKQTNGVDSNYGGSVAQGDVIGVAYNSNIRELRFYLNGADQGVAFDASSIGVAEYFPAFSAGSSVNTFTFSVNFGQKPFKYAPPQGHLPLNSASATPETVITRPDLNVSAKIYIGDGNSRSINVGIKPDFVWIKKTNSASDGEHMLYDTVRGAGKFLQSQSTTTETTDISTISSFNSDGFSLGNDHQVNKDSDEYVSWSWKAGGNKNTFNVDDVGYASAAAAGLTGGTITPTGSSVGTRQGFSIIGFTDGGSACSIPHGLTKAPDFYIVKFRGASGNWSIYHKSIGNTKRLKFTTADSGSADAGWWQNTSPTSSLFYLGGNLITSTTQIAYLWHDVPGLQKFGRFTGNSDADGVFVELGFKPTILLIKNDNSTGDWIIWDSARNPANPVNRQLWPYTTSGTYGAYDQVGSDYPMDFLSNGFKMRSSDADMNSSSRTYIYAAWAEEPAFNLYGGQSTAR